MTTKETALIISPKQVDLVMDKTNDLVLLDQSKAALKRGIQNDFDFQEVADFIAKLTARSKSVVAARTKFLSRYKKEIRDVELKFNAHAESLDKMVKDLTAPFNAYNLKKKQEEDRRREAAEQERRRLEAQRQAEAEAERQAETEDELFPTGPVTMAAATPLAGPSQPAPAEVSTAAAAPALEPEVLPPVVDAPKMAAVRTESGAKVETVMVPIARVVNKAAVPDLYKDVNLKRLEDAWEKGTKFIPGVEFDLVPETKVQGARAK